VKTDPYISIIHHQYIRYMVPVLKTGSETAKLCLVHGYLTAWKTAKPKPEKAQEQLQSWLYQRSK